MDWNDVYDAGQVYRTSGWNGIIEAWYTREITEAKENLLLHERKGEIWGESSAPTEVMCLLIERVKWRVHRDKVQQALLEYEQSQWTTFQSIGDAVQKVRKTYK